MAKEWYYVDGGSTQNTIYVADTTTTQLVLKGTEFGADDPPVRLIGEKTPNRMADQHRGVVYDPREYGFGLLLNGSSDSNLKTLKANWSTWHDRELGEGYVKRVTANGNTRCLDCFLQNTDWGEQQGYTQELTAHYLARNPFWRDASLTSNVVELTVTNPGFETFTGTEDDGTSDAFTGWTVASDDGNGDKCEATATSQAGTYALKMTRGTGTQSSCTTANIAVTAGHMLRFSFYSRGDGTYAGRYRVYDVTNTANIIAATATGVTGTTYTQVDVSFTVPAGCENVNLRCLAPSTNTGVAYFDSVTLTDTAIVNCPSVVYNGGFETFTGTEDDGTSDDFDSWTEVTDDGNGDKVEATATAHGGSYAIKMTQAAGGAAARVQSDNIVTVPGETMLLSFWTRGDGTYSGRSGVYDLAHGAYIASLSFTSITATDYTEVTRSFTVPSGCVSIRVEFRAPDAAGGVAYFDDVTLTRTTVVISLTNSGHVPSWIHATITGVVVTPVLTLGSNSQTINKTTTAASDELRSDAKPNGTTRRSVKYYALGAGDGVFVATTSGSKFLELATGANTLKATATSGTPTVNVQFYNYWRGLF